MEPTQSTPNIIPVQQNPFDKAKAKFIALPKNTKTLVVVVALLFMIVFILLLLSLLFGKKQAPPVANSSPTPVGVTPAPNIILNASRYATDSGVLKIESDLNNIQRELQVTDVKQSDLNIPNLDFNIKFNN